MALPPGIRDALRQFPQLADHIAGGLTKLDFASHLVFNLNTGGGSDNKFGTPILVSSAAGGILAGILATPFFIAISDGTNKLKVNADGSINMEIITPPNAIGNSAYGTASVASGGTATLGSFTTTGTFYLEGYVATGTQNGTFRIQIAGANRLPQAINEARPVAGVQLNYPIQIAASTLVALVANNTDTATGTFEGEILGHY